MFLHWIYDIRALLNDINKTGVVKTHIIRSHNL